jgi:hypothetical protein
VAWLTSAQVIAQSDPIERARHRAKRDRARVASADGNSRAVDDDAS